MLPDMPVPVVVLLPADGVLVSLVEPELVVVVDFVDLVVDSLLVPLLLFVVSCA
jgi:hypothetical protein